MRRFFLEFFFFLDYRQVSYKDLLLIIIIVGPLEQPLICFLVVYQQGQDLLDGSTYRTLPIQQREHPITTRKEV
jgi:hypothetical protein